MSTANRGAGPQPGFVTPCFSRGTKIPRHQRRRQELARDTDRAALDGFYRRGAMRITPTGASMKAHTMVKRTVIDNERETNIDQCTRTRM